jgi:excisionase family DNA binding protein
MESSPNTQNTDCEAFTIDEWCGLWKCGRNTAYNEIAKGHLQTIKMGRCRRITRKQNERYRKLKESEAA